MGRCADGMLLSGKREKGEESYGSLRLRPLRLRLELGGLRILSRRRGWGILDVSDESKKRENELKKKRSWKVNSPVTNKTEFLSEGDR